MEDVGEVGRDDAADAEIQQRPGRVLARRAAAEILEGDEDLRAADSGSWFRTKSGRSLPSPSIAQRIEQVLAEAGTLDGLQEPRRNDLVGVDFAIGIGAATPVRVVNFPWRFLNHRSALRPLRLVGA